MIYRRQKKRHAGLELLEDAYSIKIDLDWVALESMEHDPKKDYWLMKHRFTPYVERTIIKHFGFVPEHIVTTTYDQNGGLVACELQLLEFLLHMQGFVHPLPIERTLADEYEDHIEELGGEAESVIIVKSLVSLVLSRNKEINTLLAIRSPEGILVTDSYQKLERWDRSNESKSA